MLMIMNHLMIDQNYFHPFSSFSLFEFYVLMHHETNRVYLVQIESRFRLREGVASKNFLLIKLDRIVDKDAPSLSTLTVDISLPHTLIYLQIYAN